MTLRAICLPARPAARSRKAVDNDCALKRANAARNNAEQCERAASASHEERRPHTNHARHDALYMGSSGSRIARCRVGERVSRCCCCCCWVVIDIQMRPCWRGETYPAIVGRGRQQDAQKERPHSHSPSINKRAFEE